MHACCMHEPGLSASRFICWVCARSKCIAVLRAGCSGGKVIFPFLNRIFNKQIINRILLKINVFSNLPSIGHFIYRAAHSRVRRITELASFSTVNKLSSEYIRFNVEVP